MKGTFLQLASLLKFHFRTENLWFVEAMSTRRTPDER